LGLVPNETWVVDLDALSVDADPPPNLVPCWDNDGDWYWDIACGGTDCDDTDPNTFPGAPEICDGKDNGCDRDDTDPNINPAGAESDAAGNCADGADNDCDGKTDSADPDCGGGGCAGSAAASVQPSPAAEEGRLLDLRAFLLIPVAAAIGIVAVRRRR